MEKIWLTHINPCGAEARIFWDDKVSTMAADALAT